MHTRYVQTETRPLSSSFQEFSLLRNNLPWKCLVFSFKAQNIFDAKFYTNHLLVRWSARTHRQSTWLFTGRKQLSVIWRNFRRSHTDGGKLLHRSHSFPRAEARLPSTTQPSDHQQAGRWSIFLKDTTTQTDGAGIEPATHRSLDELPPSTPLFLETSSPPCYNGVFVWRFWGMRLI